MIIDDIAEFSSALPAHRPLLGLDLGTKTIGTALCDAGWRFATAGKTLGRGKWGRDKDRIAELIEDRGVVGLVLGLPLNMDGSEGPRAQSRRAFARNLDNAFSLPVLLWDERWSTSSAEGAMIAQDMSRA